MIKGKILNDLAENDAWDCELFYDKSMNYGIYRNDNLDFKNKEINKARKSKYEVNVQGGRKIYFITFKEAAEFIIFKIKGKLKFIKHIMRLTALMSEED